MNTIEFTLPWNQPQEDVSPSIICGVCGLGERHGVESTHIDNCSYLAGLPMKVYDLEMEVSKLKYKLELTTELLKDTLSRSGTNLTDEQFEDSLANDCYCDSGADPEACWHWDEWHDEEDNQDLDDAYEAYLDSE